MAEKRMFSKKITRTDKFIEMPNSARLLYYDLSMDADDDGFVDNPKTVLRTTNASVDDLKLLIEKSFIIPFTPGIIVIKDWRINNYIQSDRYKPTIYQKEKSQLIRTENGSYERVDTDCIQVGHADKNSIDKNRVDKISIYSEVINYLNRKSGTNYRDRIEATKRYIDARVTQGFELADFKKVIDIKTTQWLHNNEMKKYLRPETLFGTKFESYLNEALSSTAKTALDKFAEEG